MDQKETHSNRSEKNASRGKCNLDRRDIRDCLRVIRSFDGRVQRGGNALLLLLSLGLGSHGRSLRTQ